MADPTQDYLQGLRDGRLTSLEHSVEELTEDLKRAKASVYGDLEKMKMMMWFLYGAIAFGQFILPELREWLDVVK